jgi:hypothetical protein
MADKILCDYKHVKQKCIEKTEDYIKYQYTDVFLLFYSSQVVHN